MLNVTCESVCSSNVADGYVIAHKPSPLVLKAIA
jgi:hypothetical protein